MNPIEQAYKAWRATVADFTPTYIIGGGTPAVVIPALTAEKARKYAGTGRYKRTAAHKEAKRSMVIPMGSIARTKAQRESGVRDGRVETDRRGGARPTPRKHVGTGRWERTPEHREIARKAALKRWATSTPSKRARHAVKSMWQTLTPEQRSERQRKAAKKMWKRRKAEAR